MVRRALALACQLAYQVASLEGNQGELREEAHEVHQKGSLVAVEASQGVHQEGNLVAVEESQE